MPEGVFRRDLIPHQLFQLLDVREASLFLAGPDTGVVYPDFEDAAGAGFQGKFVDHAVKGGEQLWAIQVDLSIQLQPVQ